MGASTAGSAPGLSFAGLRHELASAGRDGIGIVFTPVVGSTNTLAGTLAGLLGAPAVVATHHQEAGRGRAGRSWSVPPGRALTMSVIVRPDAARDTWGWLPLLAGLAAVRAIRDVTGLSVWLKWPNDIVIELPHAAPLPGWGRVRKLGGILCEAATPRPGDAPPIPGAPSGHDAVAATSSGGASAVPDGGLVVVGIGINVSQHPGELPVEWAASLESAAGELSAQGAGRAAAVSQNHLAATIITAVLELTRRWSASGGSAVDAGLDTAVAERIITLGRQVEIDLGGGQDRTITGRAVGIGPDGELVIENAGGMHAVTAGDVRHARTRADL